MKSFRISLIFILCLLAGVSIGQNKKTVYRIDIKEEIGPKVWRSVQKSFEDGRDADYFIIDMNTYGGMVIYADSLRSRILKEEKPVWVFINNNAASAGALISIACDKIYMKKGASIGAATVVNQSGQAMPDKYQSYMRAMIRSTAEAQGKDTIYENGQKIVKWKREPKIAEAMVDERIYIENISDSNRVVTFTPSEAIKYGYCEGVRESINDVIEKEGIKNYELKNYTPTTLDKIIGLLINPVLRSILIMIIIGGIYFELQTPGIGFPILAACIACVLYFFPLYIEGLASNWELVLFILGIILLCLEIFVIPGFGLSGILGIISILISLVSAGIGILNFEFIEQSLMYIIKSLLLVITSFILAIFLSIYLTRKFVGSSNLPFALRTQTSVDDGFVSVDMAAKSEIGKIGIAHTDLRPSGKVDINGEIYDAQSNFGNYIAKGSKIIVKKYRSGQLYVSKD